jgi:hypothetical protein
MSLLLHILFSFRLKPFLPQKDNAVSLGVAYRLYFLFYLIKNISLKKKRQLLRALDTREEGKGRDTTNPQST